MYKEDKLYGCQLYREIGVYLYRALTLEDMGRLANFLEDIRPDLFKKE